MRIAEHWQDYELLDCSGGERLERWGAVILRRPDPQVVWQTPKDAALWNSAHAVYHRSEKGGGAWETHQKLPEKWQIAYNGLQFQIKCMGFKHTGLFPEQAVNWDLLQGVIRAAKRPVRVLNLFAYTGGATVACLAAGAQVTHVDAAKGMVAWAKENALLNHLPQENMRWIVEDCLKFVQREQRRGKTYDIILMDPPSYGRGPNGEVWKLEDEIHGLIRECAALLSEDALLFLVNAYTTGLSPSVMAYMLDAEIRAKRGGTLVCDEIGLPVTASSAVLPCGSSAFWAWEEKR